MKNKYVNQSIFKYAVVLILTGSFSCSNKMNDDNKEVTDPETAILGKWELFFLTRNRADHEGYEKYIPTGYVEYLPSGQMGWYDYKTKKYTLFEGKYWFNLYESGEDKIFNYWRLYYDQSVDYPDHFGCREYKCTFISNNRIGLDQLCHDALIPVQTYVYKRKK